MFALSRYRDVEFALHHPELFSSTAFQTILQGGGAFSPRSASLAGHRLLESGILDAAMFAVDWPRIQTADMAVRGVLPPMALAQLEALVMHYMGIIASEINNYQPQFVGAGAGYHAYMQAEPSSEDRWMDVFSDSIGLM